MYHNVKRKKFVAPVDVLMDLDILSEKDYENWRNGRVDYLERLCRVNLKKLNCILKEMRSYANKNNLKPSWTYYHGWGKNKKQKLRFSKSNNEHIEKLYATHYLIQIEK
jgi:hypothetical protein